LETLDVEFPPAPSQEEVKAAYRERAVETHPDQGGDAERFIEVQEAWERLPEREELSDGGQEEK
jgi:curved DNA-binding protein CbpA